MRCTSRKTEVPGVKSIISTFYIGNVHRVGGIESLNDMGRGGGEIVLNIKKRNAQYNLIRFQEFNTFFL